MGKGAYDFIENGFGNAEFKFAGRVRHVVERQINARRGFVKRTVIVIFFFIRRFECQRLIVYRKRGYVDYRFVCGIFQRETRFADDVIFAFNLYAEFVDAESPCLYSRRNVGEFNERRIVIVEDVGKIDGRRNRSGFL